MACPLAWAQPTYPTTPEQAQVVLTDVGNFLAVYDGLTAESDTAAALQAGYFDLGSPGLKEYVSRHQLTAEGIASAMQQKPEVYAGIAAFYTARDSVQAIWKEVLRPFHAVMPSPMYPPTYLLVGDLRGIAQASGLGQLVPVETTLKRRERLFDTMVHELTHFQQAKTQGIQRYAGLYSQENNMLGVVLREGGAEFVTYVLARQRPYGHLKYVEGQEEELWERFQEDLAQQNLAAWLWQKDEEGKSVAYGYIMGYLISAAYYAQAEDKQQAILDLIAMEDPEAFLAQSGYKGLTRDE